MYRLNDDISLKSLRILAIVIFFLTMAIYWLTADSSASFWDCPEYITCASRLEVGHPPGNPVWMLAMRAATIPFPLQYHALVINLCSGLFTALATCFLFLVTYHLVFWVGIKMKPGKALCYNTDISIISLMAAFGGALCFAFCDSTWFSAVEAEVYAMSAFLTSFTLWLMIKWAISTDPAQKSRLLILIAYITGLSLGVHQLNLLVIPVLALIYVYREFPGKNALRRAFWAVAVSFIIIALILVGIMNGVLVWASATELFTVNTLGLPFFSGVILYPILLTATFLATLFLSSKTPRLPLFVSLTLFIWLSGPFLVNGNILLSGAVAAVVAWIAVYKSRLSRTAVSNSAWMLFFIILGYSSFAVILIRGCASPPMNEAAPTDIFALHRYIMRDQYGSKPLVYGATPYSKPLVEERFKPGSPVPDYSRYVLKKGKPLYSKALSGARLYHRSGLTDANDSAANEAALSSNKDAYLLSDYSFSRETTPELNLWLPRITGSSQSLIDSYESWAGMNKSTMDHVEISATIDSLGNPVGKIGADGVRHKEISWRPTYMQNLKILVSYQIGYMYFRYLLWNFVGRQNDFNSTGEIEHGNFITGIKPIDDAMLGPSDKMPADMAYDSPSRVTYYGIPFILGIIGIVFLARCGKTGRRTLAVVSMFFFMTGIAIVLYLNQTPGEPRERDYSFLGSFMAFSIWIAFGLAAISFFAHRSKYESVKAVGTIIPFMTVASLICYQNFFSHNRSRRSEVKDFATNILNMQPSGVIFTYGDNFTFPLWYAQEVEGIGKAHQVIDISYLATPEYVANLMRQKNPVLRFTATPADIAYGAYAFTKIAPDADTVPVPLIQALKELYSQKKGTPVFKHSRVTLPGKSIADTLTIDLRKIASGGTIPFKKLMLLDIAATDMESNDKVPIYFLSHISSDFRNALDGALRPNAFADVYAPHINDPSFISQSVSTVREGMDLPGFNKYPPYLDPVTSDHRRRLRGAYIRQAIYLNETGNVSEAKEILTRTLKRYPYFYIPAGSFTVADTTFHEGIEFVNLAIETSKKDGSWDLLDEGAIVLKDMRERCRQWKDYYTALSPSQRETVSNDTRRQILLLPVIDSLSLKADSVRKEIIGEFILSHPYHLYRDYKRMYKF